MSLRCRSVTQADESSPQGMFKMKRAQRNTVCAEKDLRYSAIEELKSAQKMRKRQEEQNRLLGMLAKLPFFQQFGQDEKDVINRCSQAMNLEVFQPNEIVFQIGKKKKNNKSEVKEEDKIKPNHIVFDWEYRLWENSLGDKFYLIVEGEVEIFAKRPENCSAGSFPQFAMKLQKRAKNDLEENNSHLSVKGTLESVESISSFSQKESKNSIDGDNKGDDQPSGKKEEITNRLVEENEGKKQISTNNIPICSPLPTKTTSLPQNKDKPVCNNISSITPNHPTADNSKNKPTSACLDSNNNKLLLVKTLKVGESFGEIALIFSRSRLATVKCISKCVFGVLSKKQYALILQEEEAKRISRFTDELKLVPLFSNWSFEGLKDIYLNSHSLQYKKGQIVFAAGDISDAVYIVRNGEFNMKKVLQIDPTPTQEPNQIEDSNDNGCEKLLLRQCSPQKQQKQREFTIMKMCVCEMFGEEDVVFNTSRGYTVECASLTGQLLVIKLSDFMNRIIERSEILREYVLERMETKRDYAEKTEKNFKSQFQKFRHFLVEDRTEQSGSSQQQNRISPISNFRRGQGKNQQISDNNSQNIQQYPALEKRSCSSNGRVHQKNSDKIVFNPSDNNLKNNESINKSGCFSKSLNQYEESQNLTSPLQRNNSINRTKSNSTNEGHRESEQNQELGTQNNNINHSNVDEKDSKSKERPLSFSKKTNPKNENDINSFSFFEIKVSKRQTIKMANRYEYYNYLQQNGSDERFLIPIKRTLNNVVFNKPPLLLSVLSDSPAAIALNRNNSPIIHKNIMNLQNSVPIVVKPGEKKQVDGHDWNVGRHNVLRNEEDNNYESNHRDELAQKQRPSSEIYSTPKKEYPKSQNSQVNVSTSPSEDRQIVKNRPKKRLFLKAKLEPSLSPPKYELKFPQISFLTPQVNSKKEKLNNMYTDSDEQIDSFFKKSVFRDLETRNQKRIAYLRRGPPQIEFMIGNSERF